MPGVVNLLIRQATCIPNAALRSAVAAFIGERSSVSFPLGKAAIGLVVEQLPLLIDLSLGILSLHFVLRFCVPAFDLNQSLRRVIRLLSDAKLRPVQLAGADPVEMAGEAGSVPVFRRPWRDFCKTLHPQKRPDDSGRYEIRGWRATCAAEVYFTDRALVDMPLGRAYFAHLPGILTGIGIIGTFRGLIQGLGGFIPSLNPSAMQDSLSRLVGVVANAFVTSAVAITLAILFTLIEKILLSACHQKVEVIRQIIDRMFRSGAGEEYLERLAIASAESAGQAIRLKNDLVSAFGHALAEVARGQIEATARIANDNTVVVTEVMARQARGLSDVIARVQELSEVSQREANLALVQDIRSVLVDSIDQAIGSRMDTIAGILAQSPKIPSETASPPDGFVGEMLSSFQTSLRSVTELLDGLLKRMVATQDGGVLQTSQALRKMEDMFFRLQADSAEKQLDAVSRVGDRVAGVLAGFSEQVIVAMEYQRQENAKWFEKTVDLGSRLSQEVKRLIDLASQTTTVLQASILSFSESSRDAMDRMVLGAGVLHSSSGEFAKASAVAAAAMGGLSSAIDRFQAANLTLHDSVVAIKPMVRDYEESRIALLDTLSVLRVTIDYAKTEEHATRELLTSVRSAAVQLGNVGGQFDTYLDKVSAVLATTHLSFAENIDKTLNHGNARFHNELSKAVDLLAGVIFDLEKFLSELSSRIRQ